MTRLFEDSEVSLGPGALLLRGVAPDSMRIHVEAIGTAAPFRHMVTPGGFRMSVAMTNCGELGWVTDRRGYRYAAVDPESGLAWPPLPPEFQRLAEQAAAAAGFPNFTPDACLVNRYIPGAKMSLHQDRNEVDYSQPIVSVSLGLPAVFLFGGLSRKDAVKRVALQHGDVVVWGGESRLFYHGVMPLREGAEPYRYNLTFRKAG